MCRGRCGKDWSARWSTLIDTHLRPRWLIRIAGDTSVLRAELERQSWVTRVEPVGLDSVRADGASMEAGERGIPVVLAACRERLVSCEPVAADLEAAFLALTESREPLPDTTFHAATFHAATFHAATFHTATFHTATFHTATFHTATFHTATFHTATKDGR